jgi:hypothetical protein
MKLTPISNPNTSLPTGLRGPCGISEQKQEDLLPQTWHQNSPDRETGINKV